MAYIFDLDQTIVDSSIAEEYRNQRLWGRVSSLISQFKMYEGISDIFEDLHKQGEKICVVTSSPEYYCYMVLKHLGLRVDYMVCYHDTKRHKPDPEPILRAVQLIGESNENIVAVGDADNDIIAAKEAGIISGLALWGRREKQVGVDADYVFMTVAELKQFISM